MCFSANVQTARAQQRTEHSRYEPKQELYFVSGEGVARPDEPYLPKFAVKTNLVYLATTTLNASMEFGLGRRWTMDLGAAYNPFKLKKDGTNQIWMVQPELRVWPCQRFERHFFGLHAIYGEYNVGQIDLLTNVFVRHRYKGSAAGGGLSWGYHLPMGGGRWAMEFTLGAGYLLIDYDKYACYECDELDESRKRHYFGPTKAGIALTFMIK